MAEKQCTRQASTATFPTTDDRTAQVIDFAAAKRVKKASQARPLQGRLLRGTATRMDPGMRAFLSLAIREGVQQQKSIISIVAQVRRDQVRAAARAAL